ncbi:hypothetical protein [Leifsonia poae]|uniref:hypothetical protein n=1 Tax=Leifsonia poae TaxID=110933 RepID=UPI003D67D8EB
MAPADLTVSASQSSATGSPASTETCPSRGLDQSSPAGSLSSIQRAWDAGTTLS